METNREGFIKVAAPIVHALLCLFPVLSGCSSNTAPTVQKQEPEIVFSDSYEISEQSRSGDCLGDWPTDADLIVWSDGLAVFATNTDYLTGSIGGKDRSLSAVNSAMSVNASVDARMQLSGVMRRYTAACISWLTFTAEIAR